MNFWRIVYRIFYLIVLVVLTCVHICVLFLHTRSESPTTSPHERSDVDGLFSIQPPVSKEKMPKSQCEERDHQNDKDDETNTPSDMDDGLDTETGEVGPLMDWVDTQRLVKGEFPWMKLTPQIVELMTSDSKLTTDQQGELVSYLAKKMATQAANAAQQQQQQQQKKEKSKNVTDEAMLNMTSFARLHPSIAQRYKIVPTLDPRDHYQFKNERDELGKAIALKEKLGVVNKLELINPDSVMKTDQIKGWSDHDIQEEAKDWSVQATHLMWLGLMFQNDSDIRNLRSRRQLINEAKYVDLKEMYVAIELGTPM